MKLNCIHTVILLVCFIATTLGQQKKYTVANAHSHNDYEQAVPFHTAYKAGFGSIEADIFLRDGGLYVAHNSADIRSDRTLAALYLEPLQAALKGDSLRQLILLIDVKTAAEPTLDALLKLLSQYKTLTACRNVKMVVSGNRPASSRWSSYPGWIFFDGRFNENYDSGALSKVALLSDNFKNYSQDTTRIIAAVTKAHQLNKPIRFWATPDNPDAWRQLMQLNVDYINTDKILQLAEFLGSERN